MNKIIQWFLFVLLCLTFNLAHAQTELVPKETFSFDDLKIGSATFDDVQDKYGQTTIIKSGKEDESAIQICYVHTSPKGKTFIVFESGPLGGFKRITSIHMSTRYSRKNCSSTQIDLSSLSWGNGVQLGQSRKDFLKKFNVNFKCVGTELVYESASKREATKEELDKLRANWPTEKQTFFDVIIEIKARFNNNHLSDYYLSKIESY
jgi:hypothetical protein